MLPVLSMGLLIGLVFGSTVHQGTVLLRPLMSCEMIVATLPYEVALASMLALAAVAFLRFRTTFLDDDKADQASSGLATTGRLV